MQDINKVRRSFAELQRLFELGDYAELNRYLCLVTGRPCCKFCGGIHHANLLRHPLAIVLDALARWGKDGA